MGVPFPSPFFLSFPGHEVSGFSSLWPFTLATENPDPRPKVMGPLDQNSEPEPTFPPHKLMSSGICDTIPSFKYALMKLIKISQGLKKSPTEPVMGSGSICLA